MGKHSLVDVQIYIRKSNVYQGGVFFLVSKYLPQSANKGKSLLEKFMGSSWEVLVLRQLAKFITCHLL